MTNEIGWQDEVTVEMALRLLGLKEIPAGMTEQTASCRAAGMWDANEREMHVGYRALASYLAAQGA